MLFWGPRIEYVQSIHERTGISTRHPTPSSQHKETSFDPEGEKAGNVRQRQEMEDKGEVTKY